MADELHRSGQRRIRTIEERLAARSGIEGVRCRSTPGPKAIGIDEISIRKGHTYWIVVSDLLRRHPIWFGGEDRSERSMAMFYQQLGQKKSRRIRLVVMEMRKPSRNMTNEHAPQAAGRIAVELESNVTAVEPGLVRLKAREGEKTLRNDAIIVCTGGLLPIGLLQKAGVAFETHHGAPSG